MCIYFLMASVDENNSGGDASSSSSSTSSSSSSTSSRDTDRSGKSDDDFSSKSGGIAEWGWILIVFVSVICYCTFLPYLTTCSWFDHGPRGRSIIEAQVRIDGQSNASSGGDIESSESRMDSDNVIPMVSAEHLPGDFDSWERELRLINSGGGGGGGGKDSSFGVQMSEMGAAKSGASAEVANASDGLTGTENEAAAAEAAEKEPSRREGAGATGPGRGQETMAVAVALSPWRRRRRGRERERERERVTAPPSAANAQPSAAEASTGAGTGARAGTAGITATAVQVMGVLHVLEAEPEQP
jgi:hypothetical protein